ncbi:MAG: LysM domain-containing protein [Acinetobacter parvus]
MVQSGDSLNAIASKYGHLTVNYIADLNGLEKTWCACWSAFELYG